MKTRKKYLIGLIFFLMMITPQMVKSQPSNSSLPIDLIADSGEFDPKSGVATYAGNVKVTQGVSTIWADKLTIYLEGTKAKKIEAIGNLVKFEYLGQKLPIYGESLQAIYWVNKKQVTLTGKAKIRQGQDIVTGEKLSYDLNKEKIKGTKIKMQFLPTTN